MSAIDEKLKANRARFGRKLEQVRADSDLSREGRARHIAPLYQEAKAEETRLRQARRDELAQRTSDAERKVFAAPSPRGADPALVQMNYRSAFDGVEKITDTAELARKLERALLTGDKALAKATVWRANEIGAVAVVKQYMAADEQASKDWVEWSDAHSEMAGLGLGETFDSGVPTLEDPSELRGSQEAAQA